MSETVGKKIRRAGLIGLITFDALAILVSLGGGLWLPASDAGMAWSIFQFLVLVTASVIISEIISVVFWKKTVSSKVGQLSAKYPILGWSIQLLIYAAFISLAIHWVWIW